jgi:dUTP pyrophosphatase
MEVKIKKLVENAVIPQYAHDTDAGLDLTAISVEYDRENDVYIYHTGIAVESEKHYGIFLFPRSSNRKTNAYLCNHVGIVDSAIYRGEIMFCYKNRTSLETLANNEKINYLFNSSWKPITVSSGDSIIFTWNETIKSANDAGNWVLDNPINFAPYNVGDRIGQMVVLPYPNVKITEVAELSETERGINGFGSTGK